MTCLIRVNRFNRSTTSLPLLGGASMTTLPMLWIFLCFTNHLIRIPPREWVTKFIFGSKFALFISRCFETKVASFSTECFLDG